MRGSGGRKAAADRFGRARLNGPHIAQLFEHGVEDFVGDRFDEVRICAQFVSAINIDGMAGAGEDNHRDSAAFGLLPHPSEQFKTGLAWKFQVEEDGGTEGLGLGSELAEGFDRMFGRGKDAQRAFGRCFLPGVLE